MFKMEADLREWERAIKTIHSRLKGKTLARVINRSAGSIAIKAMVNTDRADSNKLRAKYFAPPQQVNIFYKRDSKKKGYKKGDVRKTVTKYAPSELTWKWAMSKWPRMRWTDKVEFARLAYKLGLKRVNAAGYVKAGWIPAISAFGAFIKGGMKVFNMGRWQRAIRQNKITKVMGTATKAVVGTMTPEASLFNYTVVGKSAIRPMLERALRTAVQQEAKQLQQQAINMIAADVRAAGG